MTAAKNELHESAITKNLAEAEAARALAALHAAQAHKAEAEAAHSAEETRYRKAMADVADINAEVQQREHTAYLARDDQNNVYRFTGSVSDASVEVCMKRLTEWSRTKPGSDIELVFYSPGGSVTAGLALWDFIQDLKRTGHKVTTIVNGIAASMAGILLQAGSVRVMGTESWLMIHEVSFGAQGKIGEIEDTVSWVKMVQERVKRIFSDRSHLSVEEVEELWRRKDAWLSSEKALELGLVDEVR